MSHAKKRPGAVIFVAIVLFIFGGYSLVNGMSTGWYAAHVSANPEPLDPNAKVRFDDVEANLRFIAQEIPGSIVTILVFAVLDIMFSIALLAGGIGVLRLAPAARKATIVLIVVGLLYMIAHDIFSLLVVIPAEVRFLELHPPEIPQGGAQELKMVMTLVQIGVYAGTCVTLLVQAIVVALVVWLLNTASAKAAFGCPLPAPLDETPPSVGPPPRPTIYTGYEDDGSPSN